MTLHDDSFGHEGRQRGLPSDLEEIPAGARLLWVLESVDRPSLSDADVVRLLVAHDRLVSHLQAERAEDMVDVGRRVDDEWAPVEIGAALHLTRTAATDEYSLACSLFERLPVALALLRSGAVDLRRARVLVHETEHLAVDVARRVVDEVADASSQLTTGQLRARIRRRCLAIDPADAAEHAARAADRRRVVVDPTLDGTADVCILDLPVDVAMAISDRIDCAARLQAMDGRTIDQRRADAAVDLLRGVGPSNGRGTVDLTVDLVTVLGLAEEPGELGGWGPVVAEIARSVVADQRDGRWQATVIDDLGVARTVAVRRRPTAEQGRRVRAEMPRCVFPGCRRPARTCDLDHRIRWADQGPTDLTNLFPLCRFHHRAKDEGGWRYDPAPPGDINWMSPLGVGYRVPVRGP